MSQRDREKRTDNGAAGHTTNVPNIYESQFTSHGRNEQKYTRENKLEILRAKQRERERQSEINKDRRIGMWTLADKDRVIATEKD